jgi:peptidoglycan/xylan/chitin deacetylase (PgdA/CDA1 family)
MKIKSTLLYLCKWFGLFKISLSLTQHGLRILCYHSFSENKGIEWLPDLFISPKTFQKRLNFLNRKKFPVLSLDQACNLLYKDQLPPGATVITIDDGWVSIKALGHQIFKKFSFPYTVYLTSYYSQKQTPLFNLVVKYMFWKTNKKCINLNNLNFMPADTVEFSDKNAIEHCKLEIIKFGQKNMNNTQRQELMKILGKILEVNYAEIAEQRFLNILSRSEIKELKDEGVDFQLHTHTHRLPLDREKLLWELEQNRSYMEPLVGNKLKHFCYPDGYWRPEHLPYLEAAGLKSAATCDAGINYSSTPNLTLKRFVDRESKPQIQFEAEICGFLDIYQKYKSGIKNQGKRTR